MRKRRRKVYQDKKKNNYENVVIMCTRSTRNEGKKSGKVDKATINEEKKDGTDRTVAAGRCLGRRRKKNAQHTGKGVGEHGLSSGGPQGQKQDYVSGAGGKGVNVDNVMGGQERKRTRAIRIFQRSTHYRGIG